MEIIIFAAGYGSRLGRNIPKILVQVGNKSLLEHQLSAIGSVFPDCPVRIISGFQHDLLAEFVGKLNWKLNPVTVHFNPFFETGIISTAWESQFAAKDSDILRMDGDVFISAKSLMALKNVKTSTLLLTSVYHSKKTAVAKIQENGKFNGIEITDNYQGNNEWVCIERYINDEYRKIITETISSVTLKSYFFEMVNAKLSEFDFETKYVHNVFEIDTEEDLEVCENYLRSKNDQ